MREKRNAIILITICILVMSMFACSQAGVVSYPGPDGKTCYSTLQRGCFDALMGTQP